MTGIVLLALLIGLPILLILLLRSNAAIIFLALCTGSVLVTYLSQDTLNVAHSIVSSNGQVIDSAVKIALLLLPAILTALFMRKSASGGKALLNLLPAIVTGVLTALLVVPLLPLAAQSNVTTTSTWSQLLQYQSFVVGAGVLISLFLLWGGRRKHDKHDKKGKHHKA